MYVNQDAAIDVINQITNSKTEKWVVKSAFAECVQRMIENNVDVKTIVEDMVPMIVDEAFKTRQLVA